MSLWTTRSNELVGIGDLVALSLLDHSDPVGRIVAKADNGHVQCVLVRCNTCEPGIFVYAEEDQLLLRIWS